MITLQAIDTLPDNFEHFMDEVSAGLLHLYGKAAAEDYRQKAQRGMTINLMHPAACAFVALVDDVPAGMCTGHMREDVGQFNFIHVLKPYEDTGVEKALIQKQVEYFQSRKVASIVCDTLPLCKVDLAGAFLPLNFSRVRRQLMGTNIGASLLNISDSVTTSPVQEEEWAEVAACIVDAYRGDPGCLIHQEVRDIVSAIDFVSRVHSGAFGPCLEEYIRAVWQETECNGAILGSRIAAGVGFVLQLVVRPDCRRQGMATALLSDLAGAFHATGCTGMVLGVTRDNPAVTLYEKLGFKPLCPVDTFYWWRKGKSEIGTEF